MITSGALLWDIGARFWHDADWRMHVTDDEGATICLLSIEGSLGEP